MYQLLVFILFSCLIQTLLSGYMAPGIADSFTLVAWSSVVWMFARWCSASFGYLS